MRIVLIASIVALGAFAAACGDDDEEASPTPTPTTGTIPWEDAVGLIEGCEVTLVMQTHTLDVYLTLADGGEVHTVEPEIDLVLGVASDAAEDCGPIGLAVE